MSVNTSLYLCVRQRNLHSTSRLLYDIEIVILWSHFCLNVHLHVNGSIHFVIYFRLAFLKFVTVPKTP